MIENVYKFNIEPEDEREWMILKILFEIFNFRFCVLCEPFYKKSFPNILDFDEIYRG